MLHWLDIISLRDPVILSKSEMLKVLHKIYRVLSIIVWNELLSYIITVPLSRQRESVNIFARIILYYGCMVGNVTFGQKHKETWITSEIFKAWCPLVVLNILQIPF